MKCPKDKHELIKELYEDCVEIDKCSTCQGMWLDEGELEKIEETIKNDYTDELKKLPDYANEAFNMSRASSEKAYICPTCDEPLEKKEYGFCSQIIIDVCPSCRGMWLDDHEIQKLEIFFERSKIESKELRKSFFDSLLGLFK